ncbi:MAG TPA: DoxX family protein [Balneolaceae bacterium]|nr:DoxX family protein [Balneolaceae bacterium]
MEYLIIALKVIVGLSILNVWLLRSGKKTQWRGAGASNLEEEFKAYGLPVWFMWTIGGLKMLFAVGLLASIFLTGYPALETYSAYGIAVLMLGAVSMHIKVKDPIKKSLPAFTFLVLSLAIALL